MLGFTNGALRKVKKVKLKPEEVRLWDQAAVAYINSGKPDGWDKRVEYAAKSADLLVEARRERLEAPEPIANGPYRGAGNHE